MKTHAVPLMDEQVLEAKGTHLTTRVQTKSSRTVVHRPIASFDLESFADRYLPVRESANFRQRRNKIGHLWMAKLGVSLAYESLLERSVLMDMDSDPTVSRVWTQPFRVDGLDENRGGRYVRPTPDILVEYDDGTLEVVEVKPEIAVHAPDPERYCDNLEALDKAIGRWQRFQNTQNYLRSELACLNMTVGVRSELSPARRHNLEYMSLYRRPFPKGDDLPGKVLEQAQKGPCEIVDLAERCDGFVSAMPVILHLVWHRELEMNIEEPLNPTSIVHLPVSVSVAA